MDACPSRFVFFAENKGTTKNTSLIAIGGLAGRFGGPPVAGVTAISSGTPLVGTRPICVFRGEQGPREKHKVNCNRQISRGVLCCGWQVRLSAAHRSRPRGGCSQSRGQLGAERGQGADAGQPKSKPRSTTDSQLNEGPS